MTSLVHQDGELCRWCYAEPATTTLYTWPTGLICSSGGPKTRVKRWLAHVGTKRNHGK